MLSFMIKFSEGTRIAQPRKSDRFYILGLSGLIVTRIVFFIESSWLGHFHGPMAVTECKTHKKVKLGVIQCLFGMRQAFYIYGVLCRDLEYVFGLEHDFRRPSYLGLT